MKIPKITNPITLQKLILILLIIIGLPAPTFAPYEGYVYDGAGHYHFTLMSTLKTIIVVAGLILAALSLALFLWDVLRRFKKSNRTTKGETAADLFTHLSITFCSLFIGWAMFPYWANGVFQAYSGHLSVGMTLSVLDPKDLMPETWIDDIWRLGVVLISLVIIFLTPFQFIFNMAFSIRKREWERAIFTALFSALPIVIFLLSPGYFYWLGD